MIAAFRNQQPDMVPVAPDISNMVPARLTGRPFWDVYLHGDPPLAQAYIDAVKYFGFDGWSDKGCLGGHLPDVEFSDRIIEKTDERIVRQGIVRTPAGEMTRTTIFGRDAVPCDTEKLVKNIESDLPKLKYFYPDPSNWSLEPYRLHREAMGDLGATGLCVGVPGFQELIGHFDGGLEALIYGYADSHSALREIVDTAHAFYVRYAKRALEARPDFMLLGASGLLTLQSPDIFREFSLPTIKEITRMCREAGIPSHLHSCGRQKFLVEVLSQETDLSSIEPLEIPPMGDCNLAELKQMFGRRIALKGNLHTTDVMLKGTPAVVRREALRAIRDAGVDGGFVLATGDQCGRDTPDENLFAMIETAREFGRYPLDLDRIGEEIRRLG